MKWSECVHRAAIRTLKGAIQELKSASSEAWGDLKSGMEETVDDLKKAYDQVFSRFR